MNHKFKILFIFSSLLVLLNCAPKIYVIDRQTVLEEEAAGDWPAFDKDLLIKNSASGPIPFGTTPATAHRERLYKVLNGDLINSKKNGVKK